MNRGMAILAVCALFVSGVAIGAVSMFLYAQHVMRPGAAPPTGQFLSGRLARELDLSEGQQEEIRQILVESWREGEELRHRLRPEVEQLMRKSRQAIEDVLTPEQRERFDQLERLDRGPIERLLLGPAPRPAGPRDPRDRFRGRRGTRPGRDLPPAEAPSSPPV